MMTDAEFDAWEDEQEQARVARRAATVPHIRQRLRPLGGNQFYRDRSERTASTMCGAEVTDVDWAFSPTRKSWPAEVCPECVAERTR